AWAGKIECPLLRREICATVRSPRALSGVGRVLFLLTEPNTCGKSGELTGTRDTSFYAGAGIRLRVYTISKVSPLQEKLIDRSMVLFAFFSARRGGCGPGRSCSLSSDRLSVRRVQGPLGSGLQQDWEPRSGGRARRSANERFCLSETDQRILLFEWNRNAGILSAARRPFSQSDLISSRPRCSFGIGRRQGLVGQ